MYKLESLGGRFSTCVWAKNKVGALDWWLFVAKLGHLRTYVGLSCSIKTRLHGCKGPRFPELTLTFVASGPSFFHGRVAKPHWPDFCYS